MLLHAGAHCFMPSTYRTLAGTKVERRFRIAPRAASARHQRPQKPSVHTSSASSFAVAPGLGQSGARAGLH